MFPAANISNSLPKPAPAKPTGPKRRFLAYVMVATWMLIIFGASTDAGSSQHTSHILRPLLLWLNPDISEKAIKTVQSIVRKGGHVSEYAVLAALLWRARRLARSAREWLWPEFGRVVAYCAVYAATDEFHQLFVPTREARVTDVLIDACGAAAGLLLIRLIGRVRKSW